MSDSKKENGRKIMIVANPIAGRGKAKWLGPLVLYELQTRGFHIDFFKSEKAGDITRNAAKSAGYWRLVFIGGDGTFHEVINGVPLENGPVIAAIPSGTGNAYAKQLGLPWFVEELSDVILNGEEITWDLGIEKRSGARFALFAGAGFQSLVIKRFDLNRRGTVLFSDYLRYAFEIKRRRKRLPRLTVEIDGKVVERRATWVDVFNISHYGGPLQFATEADPTDGLFDIMIFTGKRYRDVIRFLFASFVTYLTGRQYTMKDAIVVRGKNVVLTSNEELPFHMDGTTAGMLPVEFTCVQKGFKILAPKRQ